MGDGIGQARGQQAQRESHGEALRVFYFGYSYEEKIHVPKPS